MPEGISVATRLRQCAAARPEGGFFTGAYLLELAHELEPDYVEPDESRDAILRFGRCSGFEAVGLCEGRVCRGKDIIHKGYLRYYFFPTDGQDLRTWAVCYTRGYREPRFGVPAVRPRHRVKAGSLSSKNFSHAMAFLKVKEIEKEVFKLWHNAKARAITRYLDRGRGRDPLDPT
jgi:hypothetical protein